MGAEKRRFSATLILSGQLKENTPMPLADWDGATGVLRIYTVNTDALIYQGNIVITPPPSQGKYARYRFVRPATETPIGEYWYEEVITLDDATIMVFPSERAKRRLLSIQA